VSARDRQLVVVALGGNALLHRGEPLEAAEQQANVQRATASVAELAQENDLVVTHGNGPQVGLLALQAAAYKEVKPYPLDVLGAESEGMIGYLLERGLRSALPDRATATLLTQVVVDAADPAFQHPTKPIGPVYEREEAQRLAQQLGWTVAPDGDYFRRVVASPQPQEILELSTIRLLLDAGVIVVCAGGGGIPVVVDDATVRGVEAVIDKDLAASLLAVRLAAAVLLLLTDVPAVEEGWGTAEARPIASTTPEWLRKLSFESGSMAPKVEAACRFVEATGGTAAIGSLDEAVDVMRGVSGTRIEPAVSSPLQERTDSSAPTAASPFATQRSG
jgi:carbamate kinase